MTKSATESNIHTIGLDIAKNSFSAHGFDSEGVTVVTKDLKRGQVLAWFAKLPPCLVGLEACALILSLSKDGALLGQRTCKAWP